MDKITRVFKSYVFRSWIISNLLLLLIPIIFGISFYVKTVETISNEITGVNMLTLMNFKYILDGQFSELNRIINTLSANKNILRLASISDPVSGAAQRAILKVQDELSVFLAKNNMIDDIYISISDRFIVTCRNKYNADLLDNICTSQFCMSYQCFSALAEEKKIEPFRVMRCVGEDGETQTAILYIRPLFVSGYSKPEGTIVIRLKNNGFFKLLNTLEVANHGDVLLINALDECYEKNLGGKYTGVFTYKVLSDAPQTVNMKLLKEDTTVAHVPSDILNIEYVSVMKTAYVYREVANVRQQIYVYLAICLLLGGFVAYVLAIRNYSPLYRMKRLLLDRLSSVEKIRGSHQEYRVMEDSIKLLLDTEKQVKDIQKENINAKCNNLLVCLLKDGYLDIDRVLTLLEGYGIVFLRECFMVASVKLLGFQDNMGSNFEYDENVRTLIGSIIQSMGEGFLSSEYTSCMADIDGMMAFIINYNGSGKAVYDKCIVSMTKLVSYARESLGMVLNIGVSGEHNDPGELSNAYSETLLTLKYKTYVNDPEPVVHFDAINNNVKLPSGDAMNLSRQNKLINCLESGEYAAAKAVLEDILSMDLSYVQSVQVMKIRAFALINILLNAIDYTRQQITSDILEELVPVESLLNAKSFDEFSNEIQNIFNLLIEKLKRADKEKEPDYIAKAERYVHAHYSDPNLSVSAIANQMRVSVSYLSRNYKRYRGHGLLDFIQQKRIKASKELLGKMSIAEVANKVGYLNSKTFIRVYKKYEGITPGKMKSCSGDK